MTNKFVIEKREASIFVKSTNSKNYPEIVKILKENKRYPYLTEKELKTLSKENKEIMVRRFGQLFKLSAKEWELMKVGEENKDNKLECQLCGTKRLRWISRIKNIKTQEILVVGSECIKYYGEFRGSNGESFEDMEHENNTIKNEQLLEEHSSGMIKDIDRFKNIQNERIIIPDYLTRKYDSLKKELIDNSKHLNCKNLSELRIKKFVNLHGRVKGFLVEFDEYLSSNNIFTITDDIANWLTSQPEYDYELRRQLCVDGEVTEKTIDSIKEPNFMKGIIPSFDKLFQNGDIIRLNKFENTTFAIVHKSRPDIVLNIKMAPFINQYKDYLFHDKLLVIDIKFWINNCVINDQISMQKSLDFIMTSEFKSLYELEDVNYRDNELAFKCVENKKIYVVEYEKLINKFKETIFANGKDHSSNKIFRYINEQSNEFTAEEFNEHTKNLQGAK
ncbi:MAG: hypothetical protein RR945_11790 [Erysipelotrichaceae bacterium]